MKLVYLGKNIGTLLSDLKVGYEHRPTAIRPTAIRLIEAGIARIGITRRGYSKFG